MCAINVCARICLNQEGLSGKHIYIMSASQAALRTLKAHTFSSKLEAECLVILKEADTSMFSYIDVGPRAPRI
jgi:hypothetical protein